MSDEEQKEETAEKPAGDFAGCSVPQEGVPQENGPLEEMPVEGSPASPRRWEEEEDEAPRSSRLSFSVVDAEILAPIFFTGLFLSVMVALFYVLSSFIADAVVSFILLGLFQRPYQLLVRRVRGNRWVASAVVTVAIVVLLLLPLGGFLYALTLEANATFHSLAQLLADGGQKFIDETLIFADQRGIHLTRDGIAEYIEKMAVSANAVVVSLGGELFGNVLSLTIHAAIVVVMLFYLFADGPRLRAFLFDLSPLPDNEDAMVVETFQKVARGVVIGNGLGSAIQGALGGLAMWLVDLPSPLLWGAVMTVFAFLPLVGVAVVVVPATIYLMIQGRISEALTFFSFCMVMATFVDNVVKTRLMGSAMRMHDLLVFLSILGGITAFGVLGFVYGPLIAMLFITLHGLYDQRYRPEIVRSLSARGYGAPMRQASVARKR
jgi:predicted PurR-regulated permease PerM